MLKAALGINAKFESLSFLSMFNNIEVKGQRDQHIKINMEEVSFMNIASELTERMTLKKIIHILLKLF